MLLGIQALLARQADEPTSQCVCTLDTAVLMNGEPDFVRAAVDALGAVGLVKATPGEEGVAAGESCFAVRSSRWVG